MAWPCKYASAHNAAEEVYNVINYVEITAVIKYISRKMMLRIDLEDWEKQRRYAQYEKFRVAGRRNNFTLTVNGFSGNAGDAIRMGYVWLYGNKVTNKKKTKNKLIISLLSNHCELYFLKLLIQRVLPILN